jgi:uridine phosphorylase
MTPNEIVRDNVHRNLGGQAFPGDVAPYILITGSKQRVERIAAHWENPRMVADHYEFLLYTGKYRGVDISACSAGIGGNPVSIAIEELALLGGRTFLRIGVTSPLADELSFGEMVIAKGAVRWDGASLDYVRPEFPALAHFEVVMAAIAAAEKLQQPYKIGVIGDMASLGLRTSRGFRHHLNDRTALMRQDLIKAGVIDGTGESALMFVQCSLYGFRAGTININGRDETNKLWDTAVDEIVVNAGLETIRILAGWDRLKSGKKQSFITP